MWSLFSTPSRRRSQPNRFGLAAALGLVMAGAPVSGVSAQHVVFDPKNHLENALQAARQLESLANEARSLAASPYSHLVESQASIAEMAELARTARGLAASLADLERQFADLYPEDLGRADLERLLEQDRGRRDTARRTAADLARIAAELERLGQGRERRLAGALSASESATGQTAAVQSSNQMLAVLAEDLSALRVMILAQSRLQAETGAREAAGREAGDAARRQRWGRAASAPAAPRFDPLPRRTD